MLLGAIVEQEKACIVFGNLSAEMAAGSISLGILGRKWNLIGWKQLWVKSQEQTSVVTVSQLKQVMVLAEVKLLRQEFCRFNKAALHSERSFPLVAALQFLKAMLDGSCRAS